MLRRKRGLKGAVREFDELVVETLNIAYLNGHLPVGALSAARSFLLASYQSWLANPVPGGDWADVLFPAATAYGPPPGLRRSTFYLPMSTQRALVSMQTGITLWADAVAQRGRSRGGGGFLDETGVQVEIFVDLMEIIGAALSIKFPGDKVANWSTRKLGSDRTLAVLIKQLIGALTDSPTGDAFEVFDALKKLFKYMYRVGLFSDLVISVLEGWGTWDTILFFLGLITLLNPTSGGAKVAFILVKIADAVIELMQKKARFDAGKPVFDPPWGK